MNETNTHRAARLVQAHSDLSYQQARALLHSRSGQAKPRTAADVADLLAERTTPRGRPADDIPTYQPVLGRGRFNLTGRCDTCRSYTDDLGPAGVCYPCAALECGDLISCGVCGYWIPAEDATKACEDCGAPTFTPDTVAHHAEDGATPETDDGGPCMCDAIVHCPVHDEPVT